MEGITILNTYTEELVVMQPWLTIVLILCIGGLCGVIVFGVISANNSTIKWTVIMSIICAILFLIGMCIGTVAPRETEVRYQVITDESVTLNEFYRHYEIIKVNGQIYTVRLLTNE